MPRYCAPSTSGADSVALGPNMAKAAPRPSGTGPPWSAKPRLGCVAAAGDGGERGGGCKHRVLEDPEPEHACTRVARRKTGGLERMPIDDETATDDERAESPAATIAPARAIPSCVLLRADLAVGDYVPGRGRELQAGSQIGSQVVQFAHTLPKRAAQAIPTAAPSASAPPMPTSSACCAVSRSRCGTAGRVAEAHRSRIRSPERSPELLIGMTTAPDPEHRVTGPTTSDEPEVLFVAGHRPRQK